MDITTGPDNDKTRSWHLGRSLLLLTTLALVAGATLAAGNLLRANETAPANQYSSQQLLDLANSADVSLSPLDDEIDQLHNHEAFEGDAPEEEAFASAPVAAAPSATSLPATTTTSPATAAPTTAPTASAPTIPVPPAPASPSTSPAATSPAAATVPPSSTTTSVPVTAAPVTAAPAPAPLSIEARGQAALSAISYPWQELLPGWTVSFLPERSGLFGLTMVAERKIEVYIRDDQSDALLAHVVAHELGHAVDVTLNDGPDRRLWEETRNLSPAPWWPGNGATDFSTGAGDFAESFAAWQVGDESFRSKLGDPPTATEIQLLAELSAG